MTIVIIADDLTGANDSGIQLAKAGLEVSVAMDAADIPTAAPDVIAYDADSRGDDAETAYRKVRDVADRAASLRPALVFKKLDSTLRGNVGAEIDAVFDALRPDIVAIAPSYPAAGRIVRDGFLYVHGKLLHETETAKDPKTPVATSDVAALVRAQSKRPSSRIVHVGLAELDSEDALFARLRELLGQGGVYVVFDAASDRDLRTIAGAVERLNAHTVWAGSAGLAACLPTGGRLLQRAAPRPNSPPRGPALTVVGSLSRRSRTQLERLLAQPDVYGIEARSVALAGNDVERSAEAERIVSAAAAALGGGRSVAVYSSEPDAHAPAREGASDRIAQALGAIAWEAVQRAAPAGVVLTGGDVARRFCDAAGLGTFRLADEVEPGMPAGCFLGEFAAVHGITKAGAFGSDAALVKALRYFQREGPT
ncbi:four-carbon acid sugar kinase family protein [Paenibacillus sp.]|uniref:four-carbon acid sugar kinase family protein n=1 Tax=Paenibacillus sp. TaxID=58172 RepID=UPI002D5A6CB1|nr:four-carbon acid sugar kinase family protein [Paenibacillus sp.]HZG55022.1 four-carbon acid sugar kinase family protein [Paenibacillus sp.]